jgi:hypothetical protein
MLMCVGERAYAPTVSASGTLGWAGSEAKGEAGAVIIEARRTIRLSHTSKSHPEDCRS